MTQVYIVRQLIAAGRRPRRRRYRVVYVGMGRIRRGEKPGTAKAVLVQHRMGKGLLGQAIRRHGYGVFRVDFILGLSPREARHLEFTLMLKHWTSASSGDGYNWNLTQFPRLRLRDFGFPDP